MYAAHAYATIVALLILCAYLVYYIDDQERQKLKIKSNQKIFDDKRLCFSKVQLSVSLWPSLWYSVIICVTQQNVREEFIIEMGDQTKNIASWESEISCYNICIKTSSTHSGLQIIVFVWYPNYFFMNLSYEALIHSYKKYWCSSIQMVAGLDSKLLG